MASTQIDYDHWRTGVRGFGSRLRVLLDEIGPTNLCEVGGGANPALALDEVARLGARYTVLDIAQSELDKAPDGYSKVCMDITAPRPADLPDAEFDLMFSNMLAEHVKNPGQFHRNVFEMLAPGGIAAHFMPTMYDPMFIANRLLPEVVGEKLVRMAQPNRKLDTTQAKFPAYYRWCRGPSKRHLTNLRSIGFEVVQVTGYFGTGYLQKTPLNGPYEAVTQRLIAHPVNAFCSYAWLVLRRPAAVR